MIDQNTIIEIINKGLPILASSPVLIKLIETVGGIVKTLYTPTLTLKNGKAEVDVEISAYHVNNDYPIICFRELKKQYSNLTFSAHRIIGENDFEPNNLL